MIHADLDDGMVGLGRQGGKAQRHAPVVVEACRTGEYRALGFKHVLEGLLGAGFANAAGQGDNLGRGPRPGGLAEPIQRRQHVIDHQQRRVGGNPIGTGCV